MKRGEELRSVQEIIDTPHMFVMECMNPKCSLHGVEIETHGDDNRGSHTSQRTRVYAPSTKTILDRISYCSLHNECEECKCQRSEIGAFATEPKNLEYWMEQDARPNGPSVVTPTRKSSSTYYKRWNTKDGGSPDFNPVSNTGGQGTREGAMNAVNGSKAAPMEIDMGSATRKVKKVKTNK